MRLHAHKRFAGTVQSIQKYHDESTSNIRVNSTTLQVGMGVG